MTKEEISRLYYSFKTDMAAFAKFFFPHLLSKDSAPFHNTIYKELSSNNPFLAVECFRGAGKSTIGLIVKPIHFALFNPIGDISLISKSESFVLNEINRKIKAEFESNERIRAFFGDLTTKKWSETYFVLSNGVAFEGMGIGGQLRGGRRGLIVLDDLEDEESAISEEQRDKLKRRIGKELIPKLLPNGEMVYFGTPIHQLCYLHQIIKTPNNWKKLVFPAYKDGIQEAGHEQWPEMFPHERLKGLKDVQGSTYFASEYLCDPRADGQCPIKEKHIRYWDEMPKQYSCVITMDPAYSEDITSDYKVACVVAIDQNHNRYLLDYIRTHAPSGEYIDATLNLFIRYRDYITGFGIPFGGTEKEFYKSVVEKATQRKLYPPFAELKNVFKSATGEAKKNKFARITAALQPLFEQGKYYIHSSHLEARDELLTIGQSRWDDLVDAMTYAEQILQPVYFDMKKANEEYEYQHSDRGDSGYGESYY